MSISYFTFFSALNNSDFLFKLLSPELYGENLKLIWYIQPEIQLGIILITVVIRVLHLGIYIENTVNATWHHFLSVLISELNTAWKMSVFGVFQVRIFPHLDQKNSEYGHFSQSESIKYASHILKSITK